MDGNSWIALIRRDFAMLGRRRSWIWFRFGALLMMAAVAVWMFLRLTGSPGRMTQGTEAFYTFVVWSSLLMAFIVPTLSAGALPEAAAGPQLDLLRLTAIRPLALVSVRWVVATLWPLLFVAGMLPILVLFSLWGGVSLRRQMMTAVLMGGMGIAFGSLALLARALSRNLREVWGYSVALVSFYAGLPPLVAFMLDELTSVSGAVDVLVLTHAPAALVELFAGSGMASLRFSILRPASTPWITATVITLLFSLLVGVLTAGVLSIRDTAAARARGGRNRGRSRRVWDFSIVWRTLWARRRIDWAALIFLWALPWAALIVGLIWFRREREVFGVLLWPMLVFGFLLAARMGANTVAVERTSGTLALLMLAVSPRDVVWQKFAGTLLCLAPIYLGCLPLLFFANLPMVWVLVSGALAACLAAAFGIFCSAVFRRPSATMGTTYGGLFLQYILFTSLMALASWRLGLTGYVIGTMLLITIATVTWLSLAGAVLRHRQNVAEPGHR